MKRSKVYMAKGSWEDAINDTNEVRHFYLQQVSSCRRQHQVTTLDPSSPWGYERKHAALHSAGRYDDAITAFETTLLKISQSPDPEIRGGCIDIVPMFIY